MAWKTCMIKYGLVAIFLFGFLSLISQSGVSWGFGRVVPCLPHVYDYETNTSRYKIENNKPSFQCREYFPQKTMLIAGYNHTKVPHCTSPPCVLNEGREPVFMKYPKKRCGQVKNCVTFTIKTRHRLHNVTSLIKSILTFFPESNIVVTDEFNSNYTKAPREWFELYNKSPNIVYLQTKTGVGFGRKLATMTAQTKYVLILDDDFLFTGKTNIQKLVDILENTDLKIIGGATDDRFPFDGAIRVWQEEPGERSAKLALFPHAFYGMVPCFKNCYVADLIKNFFLADREAILNAGSWDETREFYEHEDFFFQMRKSKLKVATCTDVIIHHDAHDRRLADYRMKTFSKWKHHLLSKWKLRSYFYCDQKDYVKNIPCKATLQFV